MRLSIRLVSEGATFASLIGLRRTRANTHPIILFGVKQLDWKSVRISRVMPRPNRMPLTGGYRRTPTMQIDADIYCDTQIIIRELEARFPTPTLFPSGSSGVSWALSMWTDRPFFQSTVNLIFSMLADKVRQDFVEDRERLRGAKFDVDAMKAALPLMRDQFRAHVGWIEAQLDDGRPWLLGELSLADIKAYMNVWYTRSYLYDADQAIAGLDQIFAGFPRTLAWERRMQAIGHGSRTEMSPEEALEIAARAIPQTPVLADPDDPKRSATRRSCIGHARRLWESCGEREDRFALGVAHCDRAARRSGRRDRGAFSTRRVRRHAG